MSIHWLCVFYLWLHWNNNWYVHSTYVFSFDVKIYVVCVLMLRFYFRNYLFFVLFFITLRTGGYNYGDQKNTLNNINAVLYDRWFNDCGEIVWWYYSINSTRYFWSINNRNHLCTFSTFTRSQFFFSVCIECCHVTIK